MGQALGPAFSCVISIQPSELFYKVNLMAITMLQMKCTGMLPRRRHLKCGNQGLHSSVSVQSRPSPLLCFLQICTPWLYTWACKMTAWVPAKSLQSYPTLCNPMDCSPPGSSAHGMLQARMLEWLPWPPPGDRPHPWIEPASPAATVLPPDSLRPSHLWNPRRWLVFLNHISQTCFSYCLRWEATNTNCQAPLWLRGYLEHGLTSTPRHSNTRPMGRFTACFTSRVLKTALCHQLATLANSYPSTTPHTPTLPILGLKIMLPGNIFPDTLFPHKPPRVTPLLPTQSCFNAPLLCSLMERPDLLEKTLMLGKIEGKRRRGQQRRRWWDGITDSRDRSLSKLWKTVKDREDWCPADHGITKSRTQLSDWTMTACSLRSPDTFPGKHFSHSMCSWWRATLFLVGGGGIESMA